MTGIDATLSPERDAPRKDTAGGHLHVPYTDAGIDLCAMEIVAADGTRTPHRPPDVARQCKERWQDADRDATSPGD